LKSLNEWKKRTEIIDKTIAGPSKKGARQKKGWEAEAIEGGVP